MPSSLTLGFATLTGEVNVVDETYPVGNVKRYGALGDGSTDDHAAIQAAVESMTALKFPIVDFPSGRFVLRDTIVISSAVTLRGAGDVPGGINDYESNFPTILHDFDGDAFVFDGDGPAGLPSGSGGGMKRLRIVQVFGSPGTSYGTAIKLIATDANHKPSWVRLSDMIIEESGAGSWTWAMDIDGGGTPLADCYIRNVSTHTTGTGGAIRLNGLSGISLETVDCYDASADVSVGPSEVVNDPRFTNCNIGTLELDRAARPIVIGGIVTTITDTANTTGPGVLLPGRLQNSFASNAGGALQCIRHSSTLVSSGAYTGGSVVTQPLLMENGRHYAALTNGGATGKLLLGLDTNDFIRIGVSGDAPTIVGSIPSGASLGNGDIGTQGQSLSGLPFGYLAGCGAGGAVTQSMSKTTGVTLDTSTGQITMNGAPLAAGAIVSFTLTSDKIAANDLLVLNHVSGGTPGAYLLNGRCGVGAATLDVRNNSSGSLSEAIVIAFAVIRGALS